MFGAFLVGLLIIFFALARSCNNTRSALSENVDLKGIVKALKSDSIEFAKEAAEYDMKLEMSEGQVSLLENKILLFDDSLDKANAVIVKLLGRHSPMEPSVNTTVTTVPNSYLIECEGCFTALGNGKSLVAGYRNTVDSLKGELYDAIKLRDDRVSSLLRQNHRLDSSINGTISILQRTIEDREPRRKVLLSISAISINSIAPNGVGVGLAYQDKYNRIFAGKILGTGFGRVLQADVYMPISFRKLKNKQHDNRN